MTDGPVTPPPPPGGAPGAPASLVDRAKNILISPATEWPRIDTEVTTVGRLITGYALILAAIAPIAMLLGLFLAGAGSMLTAAPGILLKILLIVYLISLGTVVLLGFIIDLLAPNLGGTKNSVQAMKLAVFAGTAFWVASLVLILSGLWSSWLWLLLGVGYGGYLLWLGLPTLMKVPADKAPVYVGAVVGIWVVLFIVIQQIGFNMMWSGLYYRGF
jgi:hypothetical protein